jgi:hypothetical protein
MMTNWNGTILGPPHVSLVESSWPWHALLMDIQSAHENRIYSLNIHCGDTYPDTPPTVQFVSKINLPCVDQRTGKVMMISSSGRDACLLVSSGVTGRSREVALPESVEEGIHHGNHIDRAAEVGGERTYGKNSSADRSLPQIHGTAPAQEVATARGGINLLIDTFRRQTVRLPKCGVPFLAGMHWLASSGLNQACQI